jgi:putative ABC transport system substrate-binding protein
MSRSSAFSALRHRIGVAILLCCVLATSLVSAEESNTTAILYPDIREPFRGVFLNIIQGINDRLGKDAIMRTYVDDGRDTAELREWISGNGVRTVIALGSRGRDLSDDLSDSASFVLGAIQMSPELEKERYQGISLSPDPALLLEKLKRLAPSVRKVHLVYHRERDTWMVERARGPARRLGIEISAVPVDKLQEAAEAYRTVLSSQKSGTEALWLSQDSAVLDEQAVLPFILREAWEKKLIVFSSNPAHVRRGALFGLYPDNFRMGQSLGEFADTVTRSGGTRSQRMELLKDLNLAFNVRTANHLGISYNRGFLDSAQLVFPLR